MIWLLSIACILLAGGLVLAASFCLKLFARLESLVDAAEQAEEQVTQSLDALDGCYREMHEILQTPVFYDDPIVKSTVASMKRCHETILLVANKITAISVLASDEEEDEGE